MLDVAPLRRGGFLCSRAKRRRRHEASGTEPFGRRQNRKPKSDARCMAPAGGRAPIGTHAHILGHGSRGNLAPQRRGFSATMRRMRALQLTWNGRTTTFCRARRPPRPMCLPAHSLPTQNCLAQSAVGYATTNHRLARIVRRCAGEDPRIAMSSLQLSVQARYACVQSARCRNAPTLCSVGSLRKASRWP
jgi:hypothetical protein